MNAAFSMKILALEFSSSQRAVAVAEDENVLSTVATDNLKTSPLTLIDEALQKARLDRTTIEVIALGIGPGSYTGIRSAIATAQGWQLARNVKLLPISSAEVLAATARANGHRGETHLLIDAQRNECHHSTWNLTDENQTETAPLRITDISEATRHESFGPDLPKVPNCQPLCPDAASLAQLAANRTDFQPGETIEPNYLRPTEFVKAPPPRKL
jgi:tRNA threonylcarbamoyl adenosine modification protein YeaZ